jgi:hypothetical protein
VFLAWKGVVARHRALNASAALFFQDSLRRQQQQLATHNRSGTESGKGGADAGQSSSFSVTTAVRDHHNFAFTVHWSSVLAAADELRARVWRRWRARFLQQRHQAQQQSALLTLDARAALRAWTRRAEWSRRIESVEQLVNERYRLRLLADVVDTWAARTASRRSIGLLSAAVERIAARLLQRRTLHWLRFVARREGQLDALSERWDRRRRLRALDGALQCWRARVRLRGRLEQHSLRSLARRRAGAFRSWRAVVRRTQQLDRASLTQQQRLDHRHLANVFAHWAGVLHTKAALVRRVFARWREQLAARRRGQELQAALLLLDLHSSLRHWARLIARQKELERSEALVASRTAMATKARAMYLWAGAVASARSVTFLASTMTSVADRVALRRAVHWIRFVARRDAAEQALLRRFQSWRAARIMQLTIESWRSHALRARRRDMAQDMLSLADNFVRGRALRRWRTFLLHRGAQQHKCALISSRHQELLRRQCWAHWHQVMHAQLFARFLALSVRRVRCHWALRRWQGRLHVRRGLRQALVVADSASKSLLASQALRAWKAAWKTRRFKLACVEWMGRWVERRGLRDCLTRTWKERTIAQRRLALRLHRLHLLEAEVRGRYLRRLFVYWTQLTTWHRSEQRRLGRTVRQIQDGRLQRALHDWRVVARRQRDAFLRDDHLAHAVRRLRTKSLWERWREQACDQRALRALRNNVVRFWRARAVR